MNATHSTIVLIPQRKALLLLSRWRQQHDSAISHKIINNHAFVRVCMCLQYCRRRFRTAFAIRGIRKWCNFISSSKSKRHLGSEYICVGTLITMPERKKNKPLNHIHCTRSIQTGADCRVHNWTTFRRRHYRSARVHKKTIRTYFSALLVCSIQFLCLYISVGSWHASCVKFGFSVGDGMIGAIRRKGEEKERTVGIGMRNRRMKFMRKCVWVCFDFAE